jgi:hypothetical protein
MRSEGRIYTNRWDDSDWTNLAHGPQWLYDLLLSQADLEHHGVIALRQSRWAAQASDVTVQQLNGYLDILAEHRYLVVDETYGEVLVRSLLRADKIYRQPNVLRSAADRLGQVKSPAIREALHAELLRIAELADLSEPCALIVKEMLEATAPDRPGRPQPRRVRLEAKPSANRPASHPSLGSENPTAKGPTIPQRKGSENPTGNPAAGTSAKAFAYRAEKPSGKAYEKGSIQAEAARPSNPEDSAQESDAPSADLRLKTSGKRSANPSGKASAKGQPQARLNPSPAPNADAHVQPHSDRRQIVATWLRSAGDRTPSADLVATVERILADALQAGEPAELVASVIAQWQQEDGTDPARLTVMISNASIAPAPAGSHAVAEQTSANKPRPMDAQALEDLEAATVAITSPWLATLTVPPTAEALDDIEYHICNALIAGHRGEHIAATLAAWYACGSTDPQQFADLIDGHRDADAQPHATVASSETPPPVSAEDWLSTARTDP